MVAAEAAGAQEVQLEAEEDGVDGDAGAAGVEDKDDFEDVVGD